MPITRLFQRLSRKMTHKDSSADFADFFHWISKLFQWDLSLAHPHNIYVQIVTRTNIGKLFKGDAFLLSNVQRQTTIKHVFVVPTPRSSPYTLRINLQNAKSVFVISSIISSKTSWSVWALGRFKTSFVTFWAFSNFFMKFRWRTLWALLSWT